MNSIFCRENILPSILFSLGTLSIFYVGEQSDKLDKNDREAQIKQLAEENSKKLDLLFSNNLIRIQSFFTDFDNDVSKTLSNAGAMQPFLDSTLFQRVSLVKSIPSKPPEYRRLQTIQSSNDIIPTFNSPMVKSPFLKRKIEATQVNHLKHSMTLSVTDAESEFSLIWRDHNQANYFVVFNTPITEVLKSIAFLPNLAIYAYDTENDLQVIIKKNTQGLPIFITSPNNIRTLKENSKILTENLNKELYGSLTIQWRALPEVKIGYLPKAIWILGTIIVTLMTLFFRFTLIQNSRISQLVVRRTADLETALSEANEANFAKNRFLANISHELRTPLNLIIGIFDVLDEEISNLSLKSYIKSAKLSSEHLLDLITDLLHTSQDDQLTEDFMTIKTVNFFEEIVASFALDCRNKNLNLYFYINPNIPSVILGNPLRVRQILLNVIRNAIKYTNEGFVAVTINHKYIGSDEKTVQICIDVEDSGVGISEKKHQAIFERFVQLDSAKILSQGGVGLGLSIVKDLVDKLNGQISVRSKVKKGTTFSIELEFPIIDKTPWNQKLINQTHIPQKAIVHCMDLKIVRSIEKYLQSINVQMEAVDNTSLSKSTLSERIEKYKFTHVIVDSSVKETLPINKLQKLIILENSEKTKPTIKIEYISTSPLLPSSLLRTLGYVNPVVRIERKTEPVIMPALTKNLKDSLSLLVVDDDEGNRLLFEIYLKDRGWTLTFAKNGQEAFEKFKLSQPHLIIADLRMPVVDGLQMSQLVRDFEKTHNLRKTPIFIVSADALNDTADTIKNYDITSYLTKPIKKTVLINEIGKALDHQSENNS